VSPQTDGFRAYTRSEQWPAQEISPIIVAMNIDEPLRELGPVDSSALREAILAQDEERAADAW